MIASTLWYHRNLDGDQYVRPHHDAFVAGAFAAALGTLAVAPASAQDFTAAQKKIQAKHTAQVKSGKVEPCSAPPSRGTTIAMPAPERRVPERAPRITRATRSSWCRRAPVLDLDAEGSGQPLAEGLSDPACYDVPGAAGLCPGLHPWPLISPFKERLAMTDPRAASGRSAMPPRAGVGSRASITGPSSRRVQTWVFFEVHAENYMGAGGPPHRYLSAIRDHYPLSLHGVGLSIGADGRSIALICSV